MRAFSLLLTGCFLAALPFSAQAQEDGYLSAPTLHEDTIIFSSEGDLWRTGLKAQIATRITTHVQVETNPTISPSGDALAFTAHYDGPREVYIMPLAGGRPKQLTFEGGGVRVLGWTPDNKVLFSSSNEPGVFQRVLRTVDPATLNVSTVSLLDATSGTYDPSSGALFFTRFGLSLGSDNAILYRGGRMSQLWRFDEQKGDEAVRLAEDFDAPIRHVMWWNNRLYFITDKSGSDNIWSMSETGKDVQQITSFSDWQLRGPSLSDGTILYQRGADLYRFDIDANTETQIDVKLDSDRDFTRVRWLESPLDYLNSSYIGPDGKSATLTARANVVLAFPNQQRRIELTIPEDARARDAQLGMDSQWVYAILDQDLTGEIWRFPADGRGTGEALTQASDAYIWNLKLSPDGERLIYDDKRGRLWSLDIKSRQKQLIETSESRSYEPFSGFSWSSDGRYLTYAVANKSGLNQVIIRDLESDARLVVSGDKYDSGSPTFSADGNWLYFVSRRNFQASPSAPWGDRNTGPGFNRRGNIYAVQLVPDAQFPFELENELAQSVNNNDDEDKDREEQSDTESDNDTDSEIVFKDLAKRLWQVPVDADNFYNLQANSEFLFVLANEGRQTRLKTIKIDAVNPNVNTLVNNVRNAQLSSDRQSLFYTTAGNGTPSLMLVPAKDFLPNKLNQYKINTNSWRLRLDAKSEWRQQFFDAWRLHRDFAYDPALRGVDWNDVRKKYLPLVERIGHRTELDDILKQMASELGILHSQVRRGDQPRDKENGSSASLGAEFEKTDDGLKIIKVYQGETDLIEQVGPLLKPGLDIRIDDVLSAVDGRDVHSQADLSAALMHKAGQEVRLDLRRNAEPFSVIVKPVNGWATRQLRYRHWVELNRRAVKTATNGSTGYLHLQAMGGRDIASFVRDFYEHADKEGLIIDVRGNNGGNIDSFIIAILLRQVWSFWDSQFVGNPNTNMQQTFRGHLAVLINESTYSDGETFAAGIKTLDLGTLIGTRTAGAGVWLSDRNRLSDNGMARVAEFPQTGLDGRWLIEGRGISPDLEVINPPHASFLGDDAQLEAAIRYIDEKVRSEPIGELKSRPLPPLGQMGDDIR